jgi:hypothetical protein
MCVYGCAIGDCAGGGEAETVEGDDEGGETEGD